MKGKNDFRVVRGNPFKHLTTTLSGMLKSYTYNETTQGNVMKKSLIATILGLALSGCYSTGTPISHQAVTNFVKGETTTQQVSIALGKPQGVTNNSDGEQIWTYAFTDIDVHPSTYVPIVGLFTGGSKTEIQTLIVTFDESGVIKDWTKSSNTSEYNY